MLHYQSVNSLLRESLTLLMRESIFDDFRLVGGTPLSLQLGHRESVDIDLFTDTPYGNLDFNGIDAYLENQFPYIDHIRDLFPGMGKSYLIVSNCNKSCKL